MLLEDLLRMKVDGVSAVTGKAIRYSPDFRISVQFERGDGVHIIVHADGHNSDTLDFVVRGNELTQLS